MQPILRAKKKPIGLLTIAMAAFCLTGVLALYWGSFQKRVVEEELVQDPNVAVPTCSQASGFYPEIFSVQLLVGDQTRIFYTLDGSAPSLSSTEYTGPLLIPDRSGLTDELSLIPTSPRWKPPLNTVFKGTVLRAIAANNKNKKSAELTRTFFINEKGRSRYSFPLISVVMDAEDLFDYDKGIYVLGKRYEDKDYYLKNDLPLDLPWWEYPSNYMKKGSDSDRKVNVELIELEKEKGFTKRAKIRVNGNATRGYAQKSLRLSFQTKDNAQGLYYPLFPQYKTSHFVSVILRNSGNDWDKTMFRDAFMRSLLDGFKLDMQEHRPAILFLNGEYWGIHDMCERLDENYLSEKYKIQADSISILESDQLFFGKKADLKGFKDLLEYIKQNNLSSKEQYEYVSMRMNIDSFIDFIIANVYYANSDWPGNNVKCWRYKQPVLGSDSMDVRDGKWRWMLYDLDWGFGGSDKNSFQLNLLEKAVKTGSIGVIFEGLLKNEEFRKAFSARFENCIAQNFETEKVLARINEYEKNMEPEINEHIERWRSIGSFENWKRNVEELRVFARKRPEIQTAQLKEFMKKYNKERD